MNIRINIRVFKIVDRKYLINPFYYENKFCNEWNGPLLPMGTKVEIGPFEGKIYAYSTDISSIDMLVEIGVKDQEDFEKLSNELIGKNFVSVESQPKL